MAKDKLTDYSATNSLNTDVGGVNIDEGMLPSDVNNAIREVMTHLKDFAEGTQAVNNIKFAGATTTGDINFGDGVKATFGNAVGGDLQLYHDGSNSRILDAGTGDLYIGGDNTVHIVNAGVSSTKAQFITGGAVNLYHNNSLKFATTSSGIDVTGTVTFDGGTTSADLNFGDNDKAVFGAGSDLQIYHDGSNSWLRDTGTGNLYIQGSSAIHLRGENSEFLASFGENSATTLYYDSAAKLATTSSGIDVTGTVTADDNIVLSGASSPAITITDTTNTAVSVLKAGNVQGITGTTSNHDFFIRSNDTNRIGVAAAGDVSLYDSTGVTQGFFWDASTQNLGLGTTSPSYGITLEGTGAKSSIRVGDTTNSVNVDVRANSTGGLVRTASNHPLVFATNQTERMRITSTGVGIGTAAPGTVLHLNSTTDPILRLQRGGGVYSQVQSDGAGSLYLSADAGNTGSSSRIQFNVDGSEAARIDSSQNFLVSKTAADISVVGVEARANGSLIATKDNDKPLLLNRLTSDGDLIELRKAGTVGGGIGIVNGNNPYIANDADNSGLQFGSGSITPFYDSAAQSNSVDLGSSSTKFKDAYFSGTVNATSYTGDGSSLTGIAAGATGGGSDEIFWENGQNVTTDYTITNGKNAMSAGPITINTGVTVTVGTGETWTVV